MIKTIHKLNFKVPLLFLIVIIVLSLIIELSFQKSIKSSLSLFFTGTYISASSEEKNDTSIKLTAADSNGARNIVYSKLGDLEANLSIESCNIKNVPVFHGDSEDILKKGLGQLTTGVYPAEVGKTMIYGYKSTYFKNLQKVKIGDKIEINTAYGTFNYTVSNIKIQDENSSKKPLHDTTKNTLVLSTNYPVDKISMPGKWYNVYADFSEGSKVIIPDT